MLFVNIEQNSMEVVNELIPITYCTSILYLKDFVFTLPADTSYEELLKWAEHVSKSKRYIVSNDFIDMSMVHIRGFKAARRIMQRQSKQNLQSKLNRYFKPLVYINEVQDNYVDTFSYYLNLFSFKCQLNYYSRVYTYIDILELINNQEASIAVAKTLQYLPPFFNKLETFKEVTRHYGSINNPWYRSIVHVITSP